MAATNLGRVVPLHKGIYSPTTIYELNDIVSDNGSLYWHFLDEATTGRSPEDTAVWRVVVSLVEAEAYIQRAETAAGAAAAAEAAAQAAQAAAETARDTASGSEATAAQQATAAAWSATDAQTAQGLAEDAQDAAEAAQTAAEAAQTAAEAAQEAAEAATSTKADKVSGAEAGNLAALDGNGNLVDSEIAASEITSKVDFAEDQQLTDAQKAKARQNINAAAPDGYYGDSGGVYQYATNFIGKNAPQNARDIVFRPTASMFSGQAWSRDSISGQTATIEKIKGKTFVFNQLVDTNTTSVTVHNGNKYRFYDKDGTDSILTSNGTAFEVAGGDDMVTDLTRMYGEGREPQSVEEFKAQYPLYYTYNPGELISLNATGLKTVGFNQLYPDGHIDVLKGLTYKIEGTYTSLKDSAGNDVTVTNGEFTPTANDTYTMTGGSCVHLKWSGLRDGETEPHWDSTLNLPISTYFPDGMKSVGTVCDELTKDKYIKRIGKVDLGSLNWQKETAFGQTVFSSIGIAEQSDLSWGAVLGVCAKYKCITYNQAQADFSENKLMNIRPYDKVLRVKDTDYSTAAEFKSAMNGVILYHVLAEPIETPISPELNLTYRCDDFGTEMLLPQNGDEPVTAPMDADIIYQIDYEAQVRNNDSLNISKASMDAFIAAFNTSGIGTITQTWDSTNKRYAYTVTAPQPEPTEGGESV